MKSPDGICNEQVHEDSSDHLHIRMKKMKAEDKKRIEELMAGMQCSKGFKCMDSSSEDLCKVKDFGLRNYLECLERSPQSCKFNLRFGDGNFCCCPLRVYLKKKLKK